MLKPLLLTTLLISTVALADPQIYYTTQSPSSSGFDQIQWPVTVNTAPSTGSTYYFALQANFIGDAKSAIYMGLQPRQANKNLVIFSTFGTGTAALSPNCHSGADGGSGTSCSIQYNWKKGTPYLLTMKRNTAESTDILQVWEGYIKDTTTQQQTQIGRFTVPTTRQGLQNSSLFFDEYFPFNAGPKDPTQRVCVPYAKLLVQSPIYGFNHVSYPATKITGSRVEAGKDKCAIAAGTPNAKLTAVPNSLDYVVETGFLSNPAR
ncbi:DUF3472 domain-containing protein [Aquirhabdus parva]|uniref:DUF3472 domain-containing protein n=1 Tax=Aquirhabdus parva TaxID=2283318 RepID=A0A345P946_9GAMM|nr:DUF3472 domain-containing protein [Aquirhabdus parva]AXI03805.1 DUF3472 domain-containing protein [Aquirhabdus parva]